MRGYYDTPFLLRVLLLALLLGAVALVDRRRHGRAATRWREYAFLFTAASLAAAVGALNDLVTSRLSPEYFVAGKGLTPGDGLSLRAAALGAHAGFVAGALAACCILWANTGRSGQAALPYPRLARRSVIVLATSMGGALLAGVAAGRRTDAVAAFAAVRAIHLGLYLGLAAGVGGLVVSLRKAPRPRHGHCRMRTPSC